MDWQTAERTAKRMLDVCEIERKATNAKAITITTAMLMVIVSLDNSTAKLPSRRPDDLVQLYGWARNCLASIQSAFPQTPEKPN